MSRMCLNIEDSLVKKLETFIYEYAGWEYNNLELVVNGKLLKNKDDWQKQKNYAHREKLRRILQYKQKDDQVEEEKLEEAIDLFLLYLRTYDMEASISLEPMLDMIYKCGEEGKNWNCVKRVTGILTAIYLLYFCSKASVFDNKRTEENMRDIFRQSNMQIYTEEDKNFLLHIFMMEEEWECLFSILESYLIFKKRTEICTEESVKIVYRKFSQIIMKLVHREGYDAVLEFYNRSRAMFTVIFKGYKEYYYWKRTEAYVMFKLGDYEGAVDIYDKCIYENTMKREDVFDLYNEAVYYAHLADHKEQKDESRTDYIEKAYKKIKEAEALISKKNEADLLGHILFTKAFILSEKELHEEAFDCLKKALKNSDEETKKEWNFNMYLEVLMKYLSLNSEKFGTVKQIIEDLYNDYDYKIPQCYREIISFMHSEMEKLQHEIEYNQIYINLLKLSFYTQEIWHKTKIQDTSQYDILYYTKINNLKLLLEDESLSKCKYRMPLFHVYHMNDPQEGKVLLSLLGKAEKIKTNADEKQRDRIQYEEKHIYLKSFFCYPKAKDMNNDVKEFLPMWVQYGDDAEGCCVILNNKTFKKKSLRKVIYLSDSGECEDSEIEGLLKNLMDSYEQLICICNSLIEKKTVDTEFGIKVENLMTNLISQILYVFKHESYKHENEARLIENRTYEDSMDDLKVISGNVPKVFIYDNQQTYIEEIILGARVKNPEDYVPYIYKQGKKMWEGSEKQIKITQSSIQYR